LFLTFLGEAVIMNEKKRESENILKVFEISSKLIGDKIPVFHFFENSHFFKILIEAQRRFVREGPVCIIIKKSQKPRYLFLFTDLLLITTKVKISFSEFSQNLERKKKRDFKVQ
jgi:hypothetical protein